MIKETHIQHLIPEIRPPINKDKVTAQFKCAPEIGPINWAIAMILKPADIAISNNTGFAECNVVIAPPTPNIIKYIIPKNSAKHAALKLSFTTSYQ